MLVGTRDRQRRDKSLILGYSEPRTIRLHSVGDTDTGGDLLLNESIIQLSAGMRKSHRINQWLPGRANAVEYMPSIQTVTRLTSGNCVPTNAASLDSSSHISTRTSFGKQEMGFWPLRIRVTESSHGGNPASLEEEMTGKASLLPFRTHLKRRLSAM
jgi:hypothetical protein